MGLRGLLWVRLWEVKILWVQLWEVKILWVRIMGVTLVSSFIAAQYTIVPPFLLTGSYLYQISWQCRLMEEHRWLIVVNLH